jgi:hypothetical protein
MDTFFQLWDTTTGNLVTEFDSEDEAIAALRGVQADDGDGPILECALFRFDDDRPTLIAKERDLVAYISRAERRWERHLESASASPRRRS